MAAESRDGSMLLAIFTAPDDSDPCQLRAGCIAQLPCDRPHHASLTLQRYQISEGFTEKFVVGLGFMAGCMACMEIRGNKLSVKQDRQSFSSC